MVSKYYIDKIIAEEYHKAISRIIREQEDYNDEDYNDEVYDDEEPQAEVNVEIPKFLSPNDTNNLFKDESLENPSNIEIIRNFFYPDQIIKLIGNEKYNEYFNKQY